MLGFLEFPGALALKDFVFSLPWLRLLLLLEFSPWPGEVLYAMGVAKKKKKDARILSPRELGSMANHGYIINVAPFML